MGENVSDVGVLDKGMAILDAVERTPRGASELARAVGMSVSTTHRLATALTVHGLLRRDKEGRYWLGARFTNSTLSERAGPILEQLRDESGESAQLWVRRGTDRLCVASVASCAELRVSLPVGAIVPLSRGSAGQVLTDEAAVTRQGWAESLAQRQAGIGSVSAPVKAHGETVAAVCLSGPLDRLAPSPGQRYGDLVVSAASRLQEASRY
jgi:DNA-binding IclR family transcriptional regulator